MTPLECRVYDLSNGLARTMSMAIVGKQVDIVPHTGIVVFGKEVFFGGGICQTAPGQSMPMPACEIIQLGQTSKTEAELAAFLAEVSVRQPSHLFPPYPRAKVSCAVLCSHASLRQPTTCLPTTATISPTKSSDF